MFGPNDTPDLSDYPGYPDGQYASDLAAADIAALARECAQANARVSELEAKIDNLLKACAVVCDDLSYEAKIFNNAGNKGYSTFLRIHSDILYKAIEAALAATEAHDAE